MRRARRNNWTLSRTCSMRLARDSKGFTKKEGNYRLWVRRADKVGRYNVERQTPAVMKQRRRFVLSLSFISSNFLPFCCARRIQIEMGNISLSILDRLLPLRDKYSYVRSFFFILKLKPNVCVITAFPYCVNLLYVNPLCINWN